MSTRATDRRAAPSRKAAEPSRRRTASKDQPAARDKAKDAVPVDETFVWIGGQIRSLRKARNLSLDELSRATGFSIGYLSQMERGLAKTSIGFLKKVSLALDVPLGWFFPSGQPSDPTDRGVVVRASRRRQLTSNAGVSDFLLSANLDGQLKLFYSVLEPGARSGDAYAHQGEEGGYVVSGSLDLWVGDDHFVVNAGDSFSYPSTTPHRHANHGRDAVVIIWAVSGGSGKG
ncbi:cupin domain-containing protein [Pigmentiphaga sp. H8]|uniref:helix-turn-helix domain-containing protein n=1 Tax=unclassified Pigmentiphaga TaxID=2626614 RepID=UPI000F598618|nr:cupin domain-containing protein [Pigmentiphaga sp. H8]AZG06992.1 cupin domain-containing protein [Pigmentiphaga sp. H8]